MTLDGQSILITGATGSFGRKFIELALKEHRPKKLIVFSRDELKQHDMRQQFPDSGGSPMRYFLGDVRDESFHFRSRAQRTGFLGDGDGPWRPVRGHSIGGDEHDGALGGQRRPDVDRLHSREHRI